MTLALVDIVEYWAGRQRSDGDGRWMHEDDQAALDAAEDAEFNLCYPVSPYVGSVLKAPVIILNLNGGYHSELTPKEFTTRHAVETLLSRVADPSNADWSDVPSYYRSANYGPALLNGHVAAINACAYRSPKLQRGPARTLADQLPSVKFHRRWLVEALLPLASQKKRLVIAHRWGLWNIPQQARLTPNLLFDTRCRAFSDIDPDLLSQAKTFSEESY